MPPNQYGEYNTNMSSGEGSNTRMGNSDIGLLNSKIPGGYGSMASEKEIFDKA